ncbi:MAG: M50 family metallopeptidase [Rhabdochlamydiaceae bacterium]|nr:M50 family metallopeptidase [Rhabdochlamydiaceae bacterium]
MIPVKIYPIYWIFTAILSLLLGGGNIIQSLVWMVIIFVSVLFHEFGHALTAKMFGRKPRIELVAMGGITYHDGEKLPFWKQFLITLDGPLFGLILAFIAGFAQAVITVPALKTILLQTYLINIFWTVINLVPVLPLDGGQLLRIGLEKWFDFKGLRYTFLVSGIFALIASLFFFAFQQFLPGAIFFLFAFENLDNYRKSRNISGSDRNEELKKALVAAEALFREGRKDEALAAFQSLRGTTKEGMLYDASTQYAALILDDQGKPQAAYDLLKPLQERLDPPTLLLLHRLAFEHQDDSLVSSIGAGVFQLFPLAEVALRNAYAAARLKQPQGAIGWLQTAQQNGAENLNEIVKESAFDSIRSDDAFKEFTSSLKAT